NYHAVPTNFAALQAFRDHVRDLWRRSLRRRGQRDNTTYERMKKLANDWLPSPRILHPLPIRLTHTPTTCRVRPVAGIKLSIGRCFYFASDAEQRAEGVERVEAPIEAKRKFVEVSL